MSGRSRPRGAWAAPPDRSPGGDRIAAPRVFVRSPGPRREVRIPDSYQDPSSKWFNADERRPGRGSSTAPSEAGRTRRNPRRPEIAGPRGVPAIGQVPLVPALPNRTAADSELRIPGFTQAWTSPDVALFGAPGFSIPNRRAPALAPARPCGDPRGRRPDGRRFRVSPREVRATPGGRGPMRLCTRFPTETGRSRRRPGAGRGRHAPALSEASAGTCQHRIGEIERNGSDLDVRATAEAERSRDGKGRKSSSWEGRKSKPRRTDLSRYRHGANGVMAAWRGLEVTRASGRTSGATRRNAGKPAGVRAGWGPTREGANQHAARRSRRENRRHDISPALSERSGRCAARSSGLDAP